jgi:hypothetical protein
VFDARALEGLHGDDGGQVTDEVNGSHCVQSDGHGSVCCSGWLCLQVLCVLYACVSRMLVPPVVCDYGCKIKWPEFLRLADFPK